MRRMRTNLHATALQASTSGYVRDMFQGHMTRMTDGGTSSSRGGRTGPGKRKGKGLEELSNVSM